MIDHNPFRPFEHTGLEQAALDAAVRWNQPVELIRFLLMAAVRHMPASVRPLREVLMLGGPGDRETAVVALNDFGQAPELARLGSAIYRLVSLGGPGSVMVYLWAADAEADTDPNMPADDGEDLREDLREASHGNGQADWTQQWTPAEP